MNNLLFLWQDATGGGTDVAGQDSTLLFWTFMGLGMLIFYFFLIRPQQKEQQEQKSFADSLKKGSRVVTVGGLHGTISELKETQAVLLIAPKTVVTIQRSSISLELTKSVYGKSSASKSKETAEVS